MIFSPSQANQLLPGQFPKSPSLYSSRGLVSPSGGSDSPRRPNMSRNHSVADFQVERIPRLSSRKSMPSFDTATEEMLLQGKVSELMTAKNRLFTTSGRIPLDPTHLNVFFRSKSGITHSLDFPIDPMFNTPPALDVLIAACRPHPTTDDVDDFHDRESLFYPPNLPLTATLEISNHPILDAVRSTLFPALPPGHYLTTVRDKLEVLVDGGKMAPQPRALRNDGRIATIMVVLPVRFRGGPLVIRDIDGNEERFSGRGGKSGDMEWVAFTADAEYEVEMVHKGCRLSLSYAVFLKSFGPSGTDPLIHPSDAFLDRISPILNMCRGKKIAFYLTHDYGVNGAEALADSIVPLLKGGDSLLYHALKMYKLTPELHYFAGGYIWPVHSTVELFDDGMSNRSPYSPLTPTTPTNHSSRRGMPGGSEDADADLRAMVQQSGAIPLAEAEILILNDPLIPGIGKERILFVSNGEMEKLVLNILLVAYVP